MGLVVDLVDDEPSVVRIGFAHRFDQREPSSPHGENRPLGDPEPERTERRGAGGEIVGGDGRTVGHRRGEAIRQSTQGIVEQLRSGVHVDQPAEEHRVVRRPPCPLGDPLVEAGVRCGEILDLELLEVGPQAGRSVDSSDGHVGGFDRHSVARRPRSVDERDHRQRFGHITAQLPRDPTHEVVGEVVVDTSPSLEVANVVEAVAEPAAVHPGGVRGEEQSDPPVVSRGRRRRHQAQLGVDDEGLDVGGVHCESIEFLDRRRRGRRGRS